MDSVEKRASDLLANVKQAITKLGIDKLEVRRDALRQQMQKPDFWSDSQKAQAVSREEANLAKRVSPWEEIRSEADAIKYLADNKEPGIEQELIKAEEKFEELKKQLRFSGPYDDHDVILSIHAGAGGTDAQDWAEMLLRMYVRWAEKNGLKVKTLDQSSGEEAGIKSADLKISGGDFLYGKLAGEHGVHRLVRLSPFNADNLRQTSFAKVEVQPLIQSPAEAELNEKDLKIDVFRAGGHGGQSVNTTDSAVRITHIPTAVTVAIQNERSQLQNKETALNILRSKLVQLQLEQHAEDLSEIKGPNQSAEWGNQIRSYVLHPYKQVKDLRSGYESSDPQAVLDGGLDVLIDAWLER